MLLLNEADLQQHNGKIEVRARIFIHDKLYLQLKISDPLCGEKVAVAFIFLPLL